jgi:putative PEP-CTERM system histidine kinase
MTLHLLEQWSHALAALLFGALAVAQWRKRERELHDRWLGAAFAATTLWALSVALLGAQSMASALAESARNFAFLGFMYAIVRTAGAGERHRAVRIVYAVVAGVIGCQATIAAVSPEFAAVPLAREAFLAAAQLLGLTLAAGSLVLVHNLYGQAAPDSRAGIKLPAAALAALWAYDLHLYTTGYLGHGAPQELIAFRGILLAGLAPIFILAMRRSGDWKVRLSRAATFQSFSVLAILGYLIGMMTAARAAEIAGDGWGGIAQAGIVVAMTAAAALVIPSRRARAWLRVIMAKHLFEHRYDYREEWLRFARAIGAGGQDEASIGERVVKALADMAGSPGGLLLSAHDGGLMSLDAHLQWDRDLPARPIESSALTAFLERTGHVLDFAALPAEAAAAAASLAPLDAWAGIPLLHRERLVGLVILDHPLVRRPLDWEDFDLFRTAGIQAATYLAEARTQEALANAQRFDEFNRRFAFILHDIKNLVSQLSLVARNAERHAGNPAFREDMIATLQSSVKKMNDLLARLSPSRTAEAEPPRPIRLSEVADAVAQVKSRVHPVTVTGDAVVGLADPAGLEQALSHLVQNAIDASRPGIPVELALREAAGEALIEVRDRGAGMSADFIRSRLFQPFASTKDTGFGVGAFEARALVAAMGGRLEVASREGEGTCFTLFLPLAATRAAYSDQRMCA